MPVWRIPANTRETPMPTAAKVMMVEILVRLHDHAWRKAGAEAQRLDLVVKAGADAPRRHDERLVPQRRDLDIAASGQPMVGRQRHQQPLTVRRTPDEAARRQLGGSRTGEADIQAAGAEGLQLRHRRHLLQSQADLGPGAAEARQKRRHRAERRRAGEADVQMAGRSARHLGGAAAGRGNGFQNGVRLLEEGAAGLGQYDAAVGPFEQARPEFVLERPNLQGQRRLGHVQTLGRTTEMQFLGHRHEIAQVSQFHICSISKTTKNVLDNQIGEVKSDSLRRRAWPCSLAGRLFVGSRPTREGGGGR